MAKQKTTTIEATPSGDVEHTAAQLQAKIDKLDGELSGSREKVTGHETEKAELIGRAYINDDAAARVRLEELNRSIGDEQRRQADLTTAIGPLRAQHVTTQAREQAAAKAAELARLEEEVPKAREAAEESARALIEAAKAQLTPLIGAHADAIGRLTKLQHDLADAEGETWFGADLGALGLANVAARAVRAAGGPELSTPFDVYAERERTRSSAAQAYHSGRAAGRTESAPASVEARLDPVAERRRAIFEDAAR